MSVYMSVYRNIMCFFKISKLHENTFKVTIATSIWHIKRNRKLLFQVAHLHLVSAQLKIIMII